MREGRKELLIVIPAYNEAENIERVVNRLITDFPQYDYVVVKRRLIGWDSRDLPKKQFP